MKATPSLKEMNELYQTLYELRHDVLERGMKMYQAISPSIRRNSFRFSALNLAFYLAIRCHDLRPLQEKLLLLGLSSLGRSEARTMATSMPSLLRWDGSARNGKTNSLPTRLRNGFSTAAVFWPTIPI